MHMHKPFALLLAAVLLATATVPYKPGAPATGYPVAGAPGLWAATLLVTEADETPSRPADPGTLIVIDSAGKEQKLKSWKFSQGVRHLAWLAPAAEDPEPAPKDIKPARGPRPKVPRQVAGPEALVFREESSTNFVNGILTLIPLDRLRALDYDPEMEAVIAKAATGDKTDETLTGTVKYRGINKIAIEAEVDKGDLGIAEVKYLGGVPRGIKGLRFPSPKPLAPPMGRPATVTVLDKAKKTVLPVTDLQALYQTVDGGEKLLPLLMFKKTLKIDVAKVKKIVAGEGEGGDVVWQVALKDGNDETLTLLQTIHHEGKELVLEGLLGKVPAGYKLFPIHTIGEVEFEPAKEPGGEK